MNIPIELVNTGIILILGLFIWRYQYQMERRFKMAENLQGYKIEVYKKIMKPLIAVNITEGAWKLNPESKQYATPKEYAISILMSVEYRMGLFELCMFCSDEALRIYYRIMDPDLVNKPTEPLSLLADLILEIRKSIGNEKTELTKEDVITPFVSDRENIKDFL